MQSFQNTFLTITLLTILAAVVVMDGMSAPTPESANKANKAVFINDCSAIQDLVLTQRIIESASLPNTTEGMQISETSNVFIPVKISLGDVNGKLKDNYRNRTYTVGDNIFKNLTDPKTGSDYVAPAFEKITDTNGNTTYVITSNQYNFPIGANGYRIDLASLQMASKFGNEKLPSYAQATRKSWYDESRANNTVPILPKTEKAQNVTFSTGTSSKTSDVFVMDGKSGVIYYAQGYNSKDDDGKIRTYYNSTTTYELP